MNINKIIRDAEVVNRHGLATVIIKYPHARLVGFDANGREVKEPIMKEVKCQGCTVTEAKMHARNILLVERYEAITQIKTRGQGIMSYLR